MFHTKGNTASFALENFTMENNMRHVFELLNQYEYSEAQFSNYPANFEDTTQTGSANQLLTEIGKKQDFYQKFSAKMADQLSNYFNQAYEVIEQMEGTDEIIDITMN